MKSKNILIVLVMGILLAECVGCAAIATPENLLIQFPVVISPAVVVWFSRDLQEATDATVGIISGVIGSPVF